ncbi:uncharacterized protein LOC120267389 [Dioscorea cayenensis subsp. rotundata]|uniref:Uncharacterized protein LOC120267389 n=1 Tax=Dioscorea cayennensis subsp. rotundata TaxID=55577 RepID=A0AB40BU28_DIOCR|nr:uncharacterized protein LOC120267389 [Dioscorea cayenensis subsp. rotundata]
MPCGKVTLPLSESKHHDVHSCGGGIGSASHPKTSKKWVSRKVIQKLRDWPLYKAVDIQWDMLCDHGVRLPYKQAWRGKELARGILQICDKASYDLLLWYASKVIETNPGSIVLIERDGRYGGILLGATEKDGNEGFFHLVFTIVDNETDNNWTWFISKLGDALYGDDEYHDIITFISDQSKGLVNVVAKVFPSAHMVIAYSIFRTTSLNQIASRRWGEMYSNVTESFNSWIREAHHLPICNMVDSIRFKMMNMMCDRYEHCQMWDTYLYPTIHKKIEDVVEESRLWSWQVYGLPCKHACAAIMLTDTNVHRFIERYHTMNLFQKAYTNQIFRIPDHDKPRDDNRVLQLRPPIAKKRPGRPRHRRIESQAFGVRELRCSRCQQIGHNRATCNEVITD